MDIIENEEERDMLVDALYEHREMLGKYQMVKKADIDNLIGKLEQVEFDKKGNRI